MNHFLLLYLLFRQVKHDSIKCYFYKSKQSRMMIVFNVLCNVFWYYLLVNIIWKKFYYEEINNFNTRKRSSRNDVDVCLVTSLVEKTVGFKVVVSVGQVGDVALIKHLPYFRHYSIDQYFLALYSYSTCLNWTIIFVLNNKWWSSTRNIHCRTTCRCYIIFCTRKLKSVFFSAGVLEEKTTHEYPLSIATLASL